MNFYQRMGILPLKKRVNRDKCSFMTKQRMFGVFAIDEILRYRWTRFAGSRTLCHPGWDWKKIFIFLRLWISCPEFSLCALLLAPVFLISYSLCSHPNESFSNPSEEFFELNISFDFSPHPAEFLSVYFFNICFPSFYLLYIFLLNLTLVAKERGGITEQCILWGAFPRYLCFCCNACNIVYCSDNALCIVKVYLRSLTC